MVKVFDEYKYPVCQVVKSAQMDVRALVVDADSGFMGEPFGSIQQVQAEDYTVNAYPHAGVESDPLDLPSDINILRDVFDKTVGTIASQTPLDLHRYYVNRGKEYEKKENITKAVEE